MKGEEIQALIPDQRHIFFLSCVMTCLERTGRHRNEDHLTSNGYSTEYSNVRSHINPWYSLHAKAVGHPRTFWADKLRKLSISDG